MLLRGLFLKIFLQQASLDENNDRWLFRFPEGESSKARMKLSPKENLYDHPLPVFLS